MALLRRCIYRVHFVLGSLAGVALFLALSAVGILYVALAGKRRLGGAVLFARSYASLMHVLLGWRIRVEGRERLAIHPSVIVVNHQSNLDVVTFGSVYPERTVTIGKREIASIPFFGWFFRASGNLLIDRSSPASAKATLNAAAATIREKQLSVWMFPEGHRNQKPELLPLKKGPFHLAVAAQAPIVPTVAEPIGCVLDARRFLVRPGRIRIRVLPEIPTEGLGPDDVDALATRTRAVMQEAFDALGADARPRIS
jgi:1-acyl-sn-glycerol-3-phosphate acyltransferase